MKFIDYIRKVKYIAVLFLIVSGCTEKAEIDPCLETKWPQSKEYEIKLAVYMSPSNPDLPGSVNPIDYEEMLISGTIKKIDCYDHEDSFLNLGNSYITMGVDIPAPIYIPDTEVFWIGHVVYVYEFENDKDHLNINLTVQITMNDNQSYACNVSEDVDCQQITKVPMENYYYILLEIYSDYWVEV